ncbi:E3 ubiquitin-protein ligase RNF168 [Pseudophryne corroboree]|uniref:E3 ubiquitin-protein ligase RNF168 n=1 Tax=Pseudophryne corroboree TaxID=495146 RepID=UPI003081348A
MPKKEKPPLPRSECLCGICREIFLEPVTLPCKHTLCHPCFKMTVEKASLCCPFCRMRVSTWARHNTRSGTLVNLELWNVIQSQYPEDCRRRASGQDTEEDEFEDDLASCPTRLLCKPGEIREEYEAEISKIEAERLRREEEERKASEDYIQRLLAEEEEEQRLCLEHTQTELDEQLKRDEELARMLNSDLNESAASSELVSPVGSPVIHKRTVASKSKNVKGKPKWSGDIERFLFPKPITSIGIQGSDQARNTDVMNIGSGMESSTSVFGDSDEDAMPTLSPQSFFPASGRSLQASDSELELPCLTKLSHTSTYSDGLQTPRSSRCQGEASKAQNNDQLNTDMVDLSPLRSSSTMDGHCKRSSSENNNYITSTPQHCLTVTPKRPLSSSFELDDHGTEKKQKVSCLEDSASPGFHAVKLMELEETLSERRMQEEQDRLLAVKLQRLLDKQVKQVSRQKGSPDEYKLRPKRTVQEQEHVDLKPCKKSLLKDNMAETETRSSDSEETSDENKKPAPKKLVQCCKTRGIRSPSTAGVKVLRQSNKQQTILDMFKKSARK